MFLFCFTASNRSAFSKSHILSTSFGTGAFLNVKQAPVPILIDSNLSLEDNSEHSASQGISSIGTVLKLFILIVLVAPAFQFRFQLQAGVEVGELDEHLAALVGLALDL